MLHTCPKELLTSAKQRYQTHLDDLKKEIQSVKVDERKPNTLIRSRRPEEMTEGRH